MSKEKPDYFIDIEDEMLYLSMLSSDMTLEEATDIYMEIQGDKAGTHLSNKARKLPFSELSYKNLRYLVIGCQRAGAELRVKALATFIYRASLSERLAPLVSNVRLLEMMHISLQRHIETIYKWSNVEYEG